MSIQELIKQGEHLQQDFKHCIEDQKKIARTLVAFANTNGGRLLVGVKDNGKIAGINPEEEIHMIEGATSLYCQPKLNFKSIVWQEGMKLVLEIQIDKEIQKFKALNEQNEWKYYIREKDETLLANKIILKIWNLKQKGVQKPLQYGSEEQQFLNKIKEMQQFTLSKIYKNLPFQKNKIDYLVALFVVWGILDFQHNKEGFFYKLVE